MAQHRFAQWLDDDLTQLMNRKDIGLIEPGVYRGFGVSALAAGLDLVLEHGSGQNGSNESSYANPPVAVTNTGVIFSKQGVVIKETSSITLPIATNAGLNNRIDTIACKSKYLEIPGGEPAEYVVYTGTPLLNPSPAALSFPAQEVIIGYLYMPADATSLDDEGVRWVPAVRPPFANDPDLMYLNREQINKEIKRFQTIGYSATSATVADGANYIELDFFTLFGTLGGSYEDTSGTFVEVNVAGDPGDVFRLIAIQCKSSQNRMLYLKFNGCSGKTVKLAFENFVMNDPQVGTPWNSVAVGRKDLEVRDGDIVCVIGESSVGALWRILSVHSGQVARLDRSLTLQHRMLWNKGEVLSTVGTQLFIDWKANMIDVEVDANTDVILINPSDGVVQEAVLPSGYEIQIIPRWTGVGTPFTHYFRLMPGGNLLLHNDKYVILPWGRPATFISVMAAGDVVKWMLKDYMEGIKIDITDEYTGNNANLVVYTGGGDVTFDNPQAGERSVWFNMRGTTCEMSIYIKVAVTGTVHSMGVKVPPLTTLFKTGSNKEIMAGFGTWNTDPVNAYYGGTSFGDYIRIYAPAGGVPLTSGYLRIDLRFEVYNSF